MAAIKRISAVAAEPGLMVYAIVRRESDGWLLDDLDGEFRASASDPYLALAEHEVMRGLYELAEARSVWDDGGYMVVAYGQTGGAPNPATDAAIGAGLAHVEGDAELTDAALLQAVLDRPTVGELIGELGGGVLQNMMTVTEGEPLRIVRGDVKRLVFALGSAWDLTGRKAYLCLKSDPGAENDEAAVNREVTVTDAPSGACEITLTSEETAATGRYHAEVEVRDEDESSPMTALQFDVLVVRDIRR